MGLIPILNGFPIQRFPSLLSYDGSLTSLPARTGGIEEDENRLEKSERKNPDFPPEMYICAFVVTAENQLKKADT